jgi:hypothetical protein
MGCSGCSTGKTDSGLPRGCKNNGSCQTGSCDKLSVFNYLSNMEDTVGYTVNEFYNRQNQPYTFTKRFVHPQQKQLQIVFEAALNNTLNNLK